MIIIVSSNNVTIELLHIEDTVDLLFFQNVSCHSKDNVTKVVWFNCEKQEIKSDYTRYRAFYFKQGESFMCLTRDCTGTLNVTPVNSPLKNPKCSFRLTIIYDKLM